MGPPNLAHGPQASEARITIVGTQAWALTIAAARFHPHLALGNNVAKVDPDAKSDAALLGHRRIAISHPALNLGRASHCIDNAGEFRQQAIACGLDDAPAMPGDLQVD